MKSLPSIKRRRQTSSRETNFSLFFRKRNLFRIFLRLKPDKSQDQIASKKILCWIIVFPLEECLIRLFHHLVADQWNRLFLSLTLRHERRCIGEHRGQRVSQSVRRFLSFMRPQAVLRCITLGGWLHHTRGRQVAHFRPTGTIIRDARNEQTYRVHTHLCAHVDVCKCLDSSMCTWVDEVAETFHGQFRILWFTFVMLWVYRIYTIFIN